MMATPYLQPSTRVLLVDDNEDDATITRSLLTDVPGTRFEIDWVSSYDAGLKMMQLNRHDVDLLDFRLGKRSGLDLLREVHAQADHAPIIMLTGQGNESLVAEAIRSGATDYIPKGLISSETLARAIAHAVEKAKLQKNVLDHQMQLEQANQELVRKNEEIERFYHVLAHELKTPLTAASEFVGIMLDGIAGPLNHEQREYLQIVEGSCDSLKRNINDLFDISRLETGKLNVSPKPDTLQNFLPQVVATLKPVAQDKGITLQCLIDPTIPEVLMDEQRIRQVLTNLIANAMKFTRKGGTITIKASEDSTNSKQVMMSVSDTGIGILPDHRNRIFERLYQVSNDDSPACAGLGLGLFICQELIKLHGGTISVLSAPGEGSTFFFTLLKAKSLPCVRNESERNTNNDETDNPHC